MKNVAGSLSTRGQLIHALAARIQSEFGVTAAIDLLPPHSIPERPPASLPVRKRKTLSEGLCCKPSCAGILA